MGQPGMGLGITPEEEAWFGGGVDTMQPAVQPSSAVTSPSTGGGGFFSSIFDVITKTGSGIISSVTQPDVVKATLNKYVFGATGAIPLPGQPGYYAPKPEQQWIAGIPNMYVMLGGAAVLFLVLKGRK